MTPTRFASVALPILLGLFALFTPASIAGAHTSLALAVAIALVVPASRAEAVRILRRHFLRWPLLAWCLMSVLAVVLAVDPAASAPKLKKLALLALLPLGALSATRSSLRRIVGVLIAATAIVSLYGLIVHVRAGGGLEARLHGISGFYMTVAGILMIVGLLCLAQIQAALKSPRLRRLVFLGVSTAVTLAALLATYTRGSWLGFAAGALVLLRKRRAAVLGLALLAVIFYVLGPEDARDRIRSIVDPGHPRNVERVLIWKHGLGLLAEHPWTGVGLALPDELMHREVMTENGPIRVHSHMHDTYLQIAVSMGIPALAVFVWLIAAFFRLAHRASSHSKIRNLWEEGLVHAYPAILVALLVNGLFEWNFGDSEVLGLFYLLSGLVLGVEAGSEA
jgi:O-antigen ligase